MVPVGHFRSAWNTRLISSVPDGIWDPWVTDELVVFTYVIVTVSGNDLSRVTEMRIPLIHSVSQH